MMLADINSPWYCPDAIQATPCEERKIKVFFDDGRVRMFDVQPLIDQGGVFAALRDEDTFRNRLTIMGHTAAWDIAGGYNTYECIDIAPEVLFHDGTPCSEE